MCATVLTSAVIMFVFWYCHKRGRETRLEKEAQAAKDGEAAVVEEISSDTDDNDSIFGDPNKAKANAQAVGEASNTQGEDKPAPPLIIGDGKEGDVGSSAKVEDMPSVKDLPEPSTTQREDFAKV
jgi:hypothetical protein